jgi:hypothetical protein
MVAARSATKRVPVDGPPGKRGKPPTKVVRDTEGTVPFDTVARFPYTSVRQTAQVRIG